MNVPGSNESCEWIEMQLQLYRIVKGQSIMNHKSTYVMNIATIKTNDCQWHNVIR